MIYGNLTVIDEIEPIIYISPAGKKYKKRQIKCLCTCGETTVVERSQLTTGKTKSCGCLRETFNKTHGHATNGKNKKRHKLYSIWAAQKSRCRTISDYAYLSYGAKGILFSKEFDEFPAWLEYLLSLSNAMAKGYSIDRIENNKGYEKDNLRWVNKTIQQCNRDKTRFNSSGYKGVHFHKANKNYIVRIQYKNIGVHIGVYSTAKEAAIAYNNYVICNILPHSLNVI